MFLTDIIVKIDEHQVSHWKGSDAYIDNYQYDYTTHIDEYQYVKCKE